MLIERAQPLRTGSSDADPGLTALARGPSDEALLLAGRAGRRLAVLAFSLQASNFAQQPGFPVFIANAVNWLTRESDAVSHPLGQVAVPAQARVLDLEGGEVVTRAVPGGALFEARAPGLYTAMTGSERLRIAVNLLDARVTAVNASTLASAAQAPPRALVRVARAEPWILLLAAAALLLALEWWTYNRRVTL